MNYSDIKFRPATNEEIIKAFRIGRPTYRHFVRECYNPRARNGVSHRECSRSKLYVIDGVPHVRYNGELCRVVATHGSFENLDTGKETKFCCDLRIDSEYLPSSHKSNMSKS